MAFPTSPTNNQVYKTGNRAFVYDSATLVWDRVREADSSNNDIQVGTIGSAVTGTLGSAVTFPVGHVLQTVTDTSGDSHIHNGAWADWVGLSIAVTTKQANSKFLIHLVSGMGGYTTGTWSVDFKRAITGGTTTVEIGTAAHSPSTNYGISHNTWLQADWHTFNVMYVDAPAQAVGTVITYSPRSYSAASTYFLHGGTIASFVVQEIAV